MATKITDLLAEATPSIKAGDHLVSITRENGYTATHRGTTSFHNGQYIFEVVTSGVKEVASLTISAAPTTVGDVTVTLDGVSTTIAVDPAIETTTDAVASKIRNTSFSGWSTSEVGSTVMFTSTTYGDKVDATYSEGTTGATGTMSTTYQGAVTGLNVVPVTTSEDGKSLVAVTEQPIIVQETGKVTYVRGTTNTVDRGLYKEANLYVEEDITAGQEHRYMLLAFVDFAQEEFSLGVHDFVIEGAEVIVGP